MFVEGIGLNRLTSANDLSPAGTQLQGGMSIGYTYDAFANLTIGSPALQFNANNQFSDANHQYAPGGGLSSDGSHSYTYDPLGRVVFGQNLSPSATYTYDASNVRLTKTDASGQTSYISFGGSPIAVLNGTAWTDFINADGAFIAEVPGTQSGNPQYRLPDHLGSLAVLTDQNGTVLGKNDYFPHGTLFTGNASDTYQFTGLERNTDTETTSAMYRDLLDFQGRWISPDPYNGSYDWSNPQSLNRYAYAGGQLLSKTDPTGLSTQAGGGSEGDDGDDESGNFFQQILQAIFGGKNQPIFKGSTRPRPQDTQGTGNPNYDDPLNETIGLPKGTRLPNQTISDIFNFPAPGCEFGACGNSLTNYDQGQTASQLQTAYYEVTAGRIIGLLNIKNHSCGECKYDYGWNSHSADTWNVCGQILNADQMGNFMAGYQSGVYDSYYFWTTGAIWAQGSVDAAGVLYHMTGRTKATSDPLDRTGMPDILRGQRYARHGCSGM